MGILCWHLQTHRTIQVRKDLSDPQVQPPPIPPHSLTTALTATSPWPWNTSRDGDSPTSLCHGITSLSDNKCFLIFNLNLPRNNLHPPMSLSPAQCVDGRQESSLLVQLEPSAQTTPCAHQHFPPSQMKSHCFQHIRTIRLLLLRPPGLRLCKAEC